MMVRMRTVFGPDDEDDFVAARDSLVDRFEQWLVAERLVGDDAPEMAGDAGVALDWKWGYGDGNLTRWRTGDVTEFLLEWCPRKLSVSQADCLSIPAAVAAFAAFLHAEGLLAPGSSSPAALAGTVANARDEFVAAMGDTSKFGLAKSLFSAAIAEGVDPTHPESLQSWVADLNDRSDEERDRIISAAAPDPRLDPERPRLPPVALPGDAVVAESKAVAPILAKFAALAEFVGAGRKLTQTGKLTLADARVLVDRLITGDTMDQAIGDRTFKTTSSAELPRLGQVFAWAKKAGVVRVAHGKVIATKKGMTIARDPGSYFDRAVDALMAIGPLTSQRRLGGWFAWPEVSKMLDSFTVQFLIGPYVAGCPIPIDEIAGAATHIVLSAFEFRSLDDDHVARRVTTDVTDIFGALEIAGMVRRRPEGTVELTAAGVVTTHRLLIEAGFDAPTAGQFSGE